MQGATHDGSIPNYALVHAWREIGWERKERAKRTLEALDERETCNWRRRALLQPEPPEMAVLYPDAACFEETFRLLMLPDGKRVLILNSSGRLQMSSVSDGKILWDVEAQKDVTQLSMALVGTCLVVTAGCFDAQLPDGRMRTWNADSGEALDEIPLANFLVTSLAVVDARRFAVGSHIGEIIVCEHDKGKGLAQLFRIVAAAEDPFVMDGWMIRDLSVCGGRLASVTDDVISFWDVSTLKSLNSFQTLSQGDGDYANCLDITDRVIVAGCCKAPYVRVYSVADGYPCVSHEGAVSYIHNDEVTSVHILDSDHILSASDDRTIAISAVRSHEVIARIQLDFTPEWTSVLSNGSIAVTGCKRAVILLAPHAAASLLQNYAESKEYRTF